MNKANKTAMILGAALLGVLLLSKKAKAAVPDWDRYTGPMPGDDVYYPQPRLKMPWPEMPVYYPQPYPNEPVYLPAPILSGVHKKRSVARLI